MRCVSHHWKEGNPITRAFPAASARYVLLAAIIALAVWLRLRHAAQSLVYDEMAALYFSGQSWRNLWGWWMVRETNPPLFYALLKLWRMIVPMGHWGLRALPLAVGFAQLALFGWWLRVRLGWGAALLGLLLMAVVWSDIYQAAYLRGYGLARLAVLVSFIGLIEAERHAWRGWLLYGGGAVVAIYCHTTMLLWPVIALLAVLGDVLLGRDWRWRPLAALIAANVAIMVASGWVLVIAAVQLRSAAASNIAWLTPLSWRDFASSANLQLLTGGTVSAALMAALMALGLWRARRQRMVRLATAIVIATLVLFKATDAIHPIISDYTLHWCFSFTALIAAAALPAGVGGEDPAHRLLRHASALAVIAAMALAGLTDLLVIDYIGQPQDWRYTVRTVAQDRGAVLLASHESIGVVIEQSCLVEFGSTRCPFSLVVMADPRPTDNWAKGGYHGRLVQPAGVRAALGGAGRVYAFGRYYYVPLQHLGLDPARWGQVFWDDGELVGPVPARAFDPPAPHPPDPDAQYTGAPDPDDQA